jgi:hypothetical protein
VGRCKVRICRLTLAPGALTEWAEEKADEDQDLEAERILAREQPHHALDLSIAASSSQRVPPHVHGVDSRIVGRFWASNSSSDSEAEEDDSID